MSEAHGPATVRPYWAVFYALCGFTAASFAVNFLVGRALLSPLAGFVMILAVAVVKAALVAAVFMHLRWDWRRVYYLLLPACVLAPMVLFALLPDMVFYWHNLPRANTP